MLTITTAPGRATLAARPRPPRLRSWGSPTFAGCNINLAGTYTLTATGTGLTSAVSASLTITVGAGTQLQFTTQPVGSSGGTNFGNQPVVTILDAGGNPVTTNVTNVTLAITGAPAGATLTCTANPKTAVAGVAAFAACAIDKAGTYTLTATDPGLTNAISSSLTVTVGATTHIAFTTQPSGAVSQTAFATQPVVTVRDAGDNTVTTDTSTVVLTLTAAGGATLACTGTTSQAAVAGVATFAGCNVNLVGTYTLTGSRRCVAHDRQLQPDDHGGRGREVGVHDAAGRRDGRPDLRDAAGSERARRGREPDGEHEHGQLDHSGRLDVDVHQQCRAATAGVATFAGCSSRPHRHVHRHRAVSATGLTAATSSPVNITVGAPAKLAFTTQPGNATGGLSLTPGPVVAVQDAGGNTVGTDTSGVTLTITAPAGGAALACTGTTTHAAVAGVATFAACNIDLPGTYTLTAADSGLTPAASVSLTITSGRPRRSASRRSPREHSAARRSRPSRS